MDNLIWHRIFYRSGKSEVVCGAEALEKRLARKSPVAVHSEIAIIHECQACAKRAPWAGEWFALCDAGKWNEQKWIVYCTERCWLDHTGGHDYMKWQVARGTGDREPNRTQEMDRARWDANFTDRRAVSDSKQYRLVPLPADWPGVGICRWCAKEILETKGRNSGKRSKRHNWHPACKDIYFLHSDLLSQYHYLADRDGKHCHWLGCEEASGLEVDHKIPLFSVRDLPDDERREYYGPTNLWLLCGPHHKAKSAREAAQRAEAARLERSQIDLPL